MAADICYYLLSTASLDNNEARCHKQSVDSENTSTYSSCPYVPELTRIYKKNRILFLSINCNDIQGDGESGIMEKREGPRVPIELKVEYKRLNTFFADYTKNISKGGTYIKTDKPLGVGTEFIFKLFIPSLDEPLVLTGKVKWTVMPGEEKQDESAGMGIRFTYENEDERDTIERTVERLMVDSLGRHLYDKLLDAHEDDDVQPIDPVSSSEE